MTVNGFFVTVTRPWSEATRTERAQRTKFHPNLGRSEATQRGGSEADDDERLREYTPNNILIRGSLRQNKNLNGRIMQVAPAAIPSLKKGDEWRNIQGIIKTTFSQMQQSILKNTSAITNLKTTVDTLARKQDSIDKTLKDIQDSLNSNTQGRRRDSEITTIKEAITDLSRDNRDLSSRLNRLASETENMSTSNTFDSKLSAAISSVPSIADVNESLRTKANKDTMDNCLQQKVDRQELNELELRLMASQKSIVNNTVQNTLVHYLTSSSSNKIDNADSTTTLGVSLASLVASLNKNNQETQSSSVPAPAVINDLKDELLTIIKRQEIKMEENLRSSISPINSSLRQKANEGEVALSLSSKVDRSELLELLNTKTSIAENEKMLSSHTGVIASEVSSIVSRLKTELVSVINKKAYKTDVSRLVSTKASVEDVTSWLAEKANISDVQEAMVKSIEASSRTTSEFHHETMCTIEGLKTEVATKASEHDMLKSISILKSDLNAVKGPLMEDVADLQKKIVLKVGMSDACTLLDTKSNIKEVNEALQNIKNSITTKADVEKVSEVCNSMETLTRQLRSEVCIGRWIWKTGTPDGRDHSVVWNVEALNTSPDVFIWNDGTTIVTTLPGLYQIQSTFFTERAPTIVVLVNGEPVLVACDSENSKLRALRRARHSAGSVTGITISEFLALPPRSRITVTYNMDEKAQGFLSLRKL